MDYRILRDSVEGCGASDLEERVSKVQHMWYTYIDITQNVLPKRGVPYCCHVSYK